MFNAIFKKQFEKFLIEYFSLPYQYYDRGYFILNYQQKSLFPKYPFFHLKYDRIQFPALIPPIEIIPIKHLHQCLLC